MEKTKKYTRALTAAFPHTIPIMAGFLFLGMTYGILMKVSGFGVGYTLLASVFIFAGSMQFVTVNLLLGGFDPVQAFMMTLMINARHIFYGIAMLDKYRVPGLKKLYLIFGMCDESFSINCSAEPPEGVDKGLFMFFVTLLDQIYWIAGSVLGSLFGSLLRFNTEGLDFVMTAMFVVIFLENWLKEKEHYCSLTGLGVAVLCLLIFGPDKFMIPAMLAILGMLTLLRRPIERKEAETL